ncbi:MAG: pilus assembly protein PilM [Thermodesulfobacteriota bacterium]|nr:pilus assembly protein PilM [Thermodesulfobacteriota bacterium]
MMKIPSFKKFWKKERKDPDTAPSKISEIKRGEPSEKKLAGLDIGSYSVKLAYPVEQGFKVKEEKIFSDDQDLRKVSKDDSIKMTQEAVSRVLDFLKIDESQEFLLVTSLNTGNSRLRQIGIFPDENIVEKMVKLIPAKNEGNIIYDIHNLKDDKKREEEQVLVAAVEDFRIKEHIDLLGKRKVYLKIIDINPVSLMNICLETYKQVIGNTPYVVIDFGAKYTSIAIYNKGDLFLNRTLKIGGTDITGQIADNLGISYGEAEELKLNRKFIEDAVIENPDQELPYNFTIVKPVLDELINGIKYTFTYYENKTGLEFEYIFLAGGSSKFSNLDRYLNMKLGLKAIIFGQKFEGLMPKRKVPPHFALSIGLAYRNNTIPFALNLFDKIENLSFSLKGGAKEDYILSEGKFINRKDLKKREKTSNIPLKTRKVTEPASIEDNFLGKIKEKIFLILSSSKEGTASDRNINRKEIIEVSLTIIGGVLLAVIFLNQLFFTPAKKSSLRELKKYTDVHNKMAEVEYITRSIQPVKETSDKILWSRKLKAVSAVIPKELWIPSLYVKMESFQTRNKNEEIQKRTLFIEGRIKLDSAKGHLNYIADFLKNLNDDKGDFRCSDISKTGFDFNTLNFVEAKPNKEDPQLVDFVIACPYNERFLKVVKMKKEKSPAELLEKFIGSTDIVEKFIKK